MRIAFVSVRGIPNDNGGFEQFAQYLSVRLAERGHEVTVYSPSYHPYKGDEYEGVRIKHVYSPEPWMGSSVGSFFYDFLSLRDALRHESFDIIYEAGYTSIIPAFVWFDVRHVTKSVVVTNMDGLEYRRAKFSRLARLFLRWEEKMAVRHSHYLVADNMAIHDYYLRKYGRESKYLAYGADIHADYSTAYSRELGLQPEEYYLVVARMEPENNIAMAIEGYLRSGEKGRRPLVVVGKTTTPHGKALVAKYGSEEGVMFVGGIFDFDRLNSIRHFSKAYFHGHSVGGTNPSLLEAMASECLVFAHDNIFNRTVLGGGSLYYRDAAGVTALLDNIDTICASHKSSFTRRNLELIRREYSWERIADRHEEYFQWLLEQRRHGGEVSPCASAER